MNATCNSSKNAPPLSRQKLPLQRLLRTVPAIGVVVMILVLGLGSLSAMAQEPDRAADLGDAPDSLSNHHGIDNTAYPGVRGRFPTVWEGTPAGEGSGPLHLNIDQFWLGDHVSQEVEADNGADSDGTNNILNGGADEADKDRGDDGWLNPNVFLADCQEAILRVRIAKDPNAQPRQLYLNVWHDGNGDGDWADQGLCEGQVEGHSNEWIVHNAVIDTSTITGTSADFSIKTILVYNEKPDAPAWLRFTLSEQQAPRPPAQPDAPQAPEADGRGPDYPNAYEVGETEDYLQVPDPENRPRPDLGDAPDSDDNHWSATNRAYPSVDGHFPTVWEGTPAGSPTGPLHAHPHVIWLGDHVTAEKDADQLPDADGVSNILNGGANEANKDRGDDGWLNAKHTLFVDCEETTLRVRVSKGTLADDERMFLNVYYDGNRNGRWGERKICGESQNEAGETNVTYAHEWIVQNFIVNTGVISGHADIIVPTMKVLNDQPDAPAWVRFTLSEVPVTELAPFQHDGRGPDFPKFYQQGETEDYLHHPPEQGEPGQIEMRKTTSLPSSTVVSLGDVFSYTIDLQHNGGTAPTHVVITDVLPPEVKLMQGPFATEVISYVAPLTALFDGSIGPSGQVKWDGHLAPNAHVRLEFAVSVRHCPPPDRQIIHNVAHAQQQGGTAIEDQADVAIQCQPPERPEITLHKKFVPEIEPQPNETDTGEHPIVPGHPGVYLLELNSTDNLSHTVHVTDTLPAGIVATSAGADNGVAQVTDGGQAVVWNVEIGPARRPVHLKIRVNPTDRLRCEQRVENVAEWVVRLEGGEIVGGHSNPVRIYLACRDHGDAPDSTNHAGTIMPAYPGVTAHFPTVFQIGPPDRGPRHERPKLFHLGRGVSAEREADVGPDVDGANNIDPAFNQPNQDRFDDGLVRDEFALRHCRIARFPVWVSIDPAFLAGLPENEEGLGYLNAWIDSNRDGDWADHFDCPALEGENAARALEHIVIDRPIDVKALGAGLHKVYVETTVPVFWPKEQTERPAWLRLTLSERPSNKTYDCGAGSCGFGDGRGYDVPFRFGETEDYLIRPKPSDQPEPTEGADPTVHKHGTLIPERDPASGVPVWLAQWNVRYENAGYATANDVVVVDNLDGGQTLRAERSTPVITPTVSSNTLEYNVGTVGPSQVGHINLRSSVSFDTPPGTILTNTAVISGSNDSDASNNTSVYTLTVPLLPPAITYPTPGTTCTGTFTVTGRAQPGASVDLYINGSLETSLTADAGGHWSTAVSLADGTYDLYAVARYGTLTSPPSATVQVIVDSSLFFDPLSLRFEDESGHVIIPRDHNGRTDESGWRIFLRRGSTYTVTVGICCSSPNAVVELELDGVGSITLTDPDGDGIYSATFTTPSTGSISGSIRICVTCELIKRCSDGELTIDPEGTVYDVGSGQPLNAATVACMQSQVSSASGESVFSLWPAADFDQANPQSTATDGYFSFFTPPGAYRLEVTKEGYQAYRSQDLVVVDAPVHFDVPLTPAIAEPADYVVTVDGAGFDPSVLEVPAGSVVEWINLDSEVHSSTSVTPTVSCETCSASLSSSDGWDSGLLTSGEAYKRELTALGTYVYQDAENPTVTATILVVETVNESPQERLFLPFVTQ